MWHVYIYMYIYMFTHTHTLNQILHVVLVTHPSHWVSQHWSKQQNPRHVGDAVVVFDERRVVPLWQATVTGMMQFYFCQGWRVGIPSLKISEHGDVIALFAFESYSWWIYLGTNFIHFHMVYFPPSFVSSLECSVGVRISMIMNKNLLERTLATFSLKKRLERTKKAVQPESQCFWWFQGVLVPVLMKDLQL